MIKHVTRTKIVATIGPASDSIEKLEKLMKAGMRVARLNFSHGDYKSHARLVKNVRRAAKNVGIEVAILQDLQGPRIRIGNVKEEGIKIKRGQRVALVSQKMHDQNGRGLQSLPIQYEDLYKDVKKNTRILIEDGTIQLRVVKVRDAVIFCKVQVPGIIKSHKGMNIPGASLSVNVITKKDREDIAFGQTQEVDYVALSFVKDASDIKELRRLIAKSQKKGVTIPTKTMAKIERQEALDNFTEIVKEVDSIMIGRGDLGIEIEAQRVPIWQKTIIASCLQHAKPVIVATQMLDSMIRNPHPTRAEVSDVSNAVIDHTDAVMLSGESAIGNYPVEAVAIMSKIAYAAEESKFDDFLCGPKKVEGRKAGLAQAACHLWRSTNAKAAVVFTASGESARLLARHRPELPIIALTPEKKTQRQLALSWGVIGLPITKKTSLKAGLSKAVQFLQKQKMIKKGDAVILAAADEGVSKDMDLTHVRVWHVGEKI